MCSHCRAIIYFYTNSICTLQTHRNTFLSSNRRQYPRYPITVDIKISHPEIGEKTVKTKNISDGGVFILVGAIGMPSPGEIVKGQVQGMVDNPPILDMKIVRTEKDGLGLRYIDSEM